jgi:flagellar protein FliO/FliZ
MYLTNSPIQQFRNLVLSKAEGVAADKRKIIILLAVVVLSGGAVMFRSPHSAAKPAPSAGSGQALSPSAALRVNSVEGSSGSKDAQEKFEIPAKGGQDLGRGELFLKMMFSVLLVVLLGAGAVYMSKKVLPRISNLPGKEIRVLETAYLGPRKAVHLIRIGNQRILIGSTNESITMLADVTDAIGQDEPDFVDPSAQQISACVRK